ncbi:MAG: hypothetical protein JSS82_15785 [Bacteroidetes bacterium]|nr:hypothetical protein [Bacteroidota bacterium]
MDAVGAELQHKDAQLDASIVDGLELRRLLTASERFFTISERTTLRVVGIVTPLTIDFLGGAVDAGAELLHEGPQLGASIGDVLELRSLLTASERFFTSSGLSIPTGIVGSTPIVFDVSDIIGLVFETKLSDWSIYVK